jgi:putative ABC transport system permease protein
MLFYYLKIALRNIKKQKGYFVLNFLGLAIGLSVTMVISLYVLDDLTFDQFHEKGDHIYRLLSVGVKRGTINSITAGALVQDANDNIPEVKYASRVTMGGDNRQFGPIGTDFRNPDAPSVVTARAIYADAHFFDIFSFKILEGASGQALGQPDSVFLTPEKARALFDDENPVGKPIAVRGMENAKIAGLVEPPPSNSHIQFEMILPLIPEENPRFFNSWDTLAIRGYVLLEENVDIDHLLAKINENALKSGYPEIFEAQLQPLADIHLGSSNHSYDTLNVGRSDKTVFYTMSFVGFLVLLIACINFVNLTTSRASRRALEVGLRKVVGSKRGQLMRQFLSESVLTTLLAFMAALFLVDLSLPFLNSVMKKNLALNFQHDFILFVAMLAAVVLVGLISGLYPAVIISSFRPVNVLKGQFKTGTKGVFLRKALVVFQFSITTILLISVYIVVAQIRHLQSIDLGYNRSHVLVIPSPLREGDDLFKQRLSSMPGILSVGRIDSTPAPNFWRFEIIREGAERTENLTASRFAIDEDAFKTLEISIIEGRNFSKEFSSDADEAVIINETLVRKYEFENPIGTTLRYYDESQETTIVSRQIVGVIKDFHYVTARQESEPMIFLLNPRGSFLLMAKVAPGQIDQVLPQMEKHYKDVYPNRAFAYEFLDESFNQQFSQDRDFMRNISLFSGLAIFIACLGLIGLVAYTIEQRRKEIAIRKVLGSGERKIYSFLTIDFIKWILISNLIAWPAGYFATRAWLNDFVFRVPFRPWAFGLVSLGVLVIAIMTISIQTFRAVRSDPIQSLRDVG